MESIPTEVTTQILSVLPAKSVLRCRSVCKTWRNLIDEPPFAASHLDREIIRSKSTGNNTQTRFLLRPLIEDESEIYLIEQQQEEEEDSSSILFKCTKMNPLPNIISTHQFTSLTNVNGLFFVSEYQGHTFLCNPFTGKSLMLPESHFRKCCITRGFGYDLVNKVFKLVQMIYPRVRGFSGTEAYVYTFGMGSNSSWKKLENAPSVIFRRSGVYANGHLHWLPNNSSSMFSFDLASETFGVIPLPEMKSSPSTLTYVTNVDGCLSILDLNDGIELWVMKEYGVRESWIKVVVSGTDVENGASLMSIQPISFWKEGEILLVCDSKTLVSYNVENGRFTPLEIIGLPDCGFYEVFPYCGNILPLQPTNEKSYLEANLEL